MSKSKSETPAEFEELFSAKELAADREFRRLPSTKPFTLTEVPTKHVKAEGAGKSPAFVAAGTCEGATFKFAVPALIANKLLTLPAEKYVGKVLVYRNNSIAVAK